MQDESWKKSSTKQEDAKTNAELDDILDNLPETEEWANSLLVKEINNDESAVTDIHREKMVESLVSLVFC